MTEIDNGALDPIQRLDSLNVLRQACHNFLETTRIVEGEDDVLTFRLEMPQIKKDYFYLRGEISSHDNPVESSRAAKAFINGIKCVLHKNPLSAHVVGLPEDTKTTCYFIGHSPDGRHLPEITEEIYKAHDRYVIGAINQRKVFGNDTRETDNSALIALLPRHPDSLLEELNIRFRYNNEIACGVSFLKTAVQLAQGQVSSVIDKDAHSQIWRCICSDSGVVIPSVLSETEVKKICPCSQLSRNDGAALALH